ncbi:hypothetical protein BDR03DRAFT_954718 [Suillus americanus]|nr:hypothetical protein BDR03DRAFT_954718 [Suillus americanus]
MKGFLSLVLVSIALLQMTAAAPTVSGGSEAVQKREGEQSMSQLVCSICTRLTRICREAQRDLCSLYVPHRLGG